MNKSKLSKILGISRPTLDVALKNPEKYPSITHYLEQKEDIELNNRCVKILGLHNKVTPTDIDSILEFLGDYKYLSEEGKKFAIQYWNLFIKE